MKLTEWEYHILLFNAAKCFQEYAQANAANQELRKQLQRINELMDALDPKGALPKPDAGTAIA